MEPIVLDDKNIRPTNDLVFSIIGDKSDFWKLIMKYLHDKYNDVTEQWNFYNDGKKWLFRTLKKKKTIFWIGVLKDTFRVTFWFGDKAEPYIVQGDLPQSVKDDFKNAKKYNAVRAVSIEIQNSGDVETVIKLIEIKLCLK